MTGLDGKTYPRPVSVDHAALADAAVAEFPDLAYLRDETHDLEECWRTADSLRKFDEPELSERLAIFRRHVEVDRSKRAGTHVPPALPKCCPTCGQTVRTADA